MRLKIGVLVGVFIVLCMVLQVDALDGKTLYVDGYNADGPWDGTIEHPYRFIQQAIDNASDGDTIYVFNGVYDERIKVDKTLSILGEDKNITIIKQGCSIYADNVVLKNFTIRCKPIGILERALYIKSRDNEVQDNIIFGIVEGVDHNEISNNYISSWRTAMCLKSDENIVENNIINGYVSYGILLINSDNNVIQWNEFSSQGISLSLTMSNGNTIRYNNFLDVVTNAYFINSYGTTWDGNYWLLWPHILPKPIFGGYAPLFNKWNLLILYIPLVNLDLHPASETIRYLNNPLSPSFKI